MCFIFLLLLSLYLESSTTYIPLTSFDAFDSYLCNYQVENLQDICTASPVCSVGSIYEFSCDCGQVIKRVKVHAESAEDVWALKLMNFIVGANQLLFDGLTRELPL